MAVEQGKVIAKLNEILKGKSVTDNYKKTLATKWAAKIEKDEDIEAFIEDRKDDILEASKEADRRVTTAVKDEKDKTLEVIKGKTEITEPEAKVPEDAPEWAKKLIAQNLELKQSFTTLKAEKSQETIAERFKKEFAESKVPESILKRYLPKTEEEFEANKAELSETWNAIGVENKSKGFGSDRPSGNANSGSAKSEEPTKESVDAIMANLNI